MIAGDLAAGVLRNWPLHGLQGSLRGAAGSLLDSEQELSFIGIGRENPTKIFLVGSISAIVTAVVLAGGTVEIGAAGVKASTPGLIQSVVNIWKNPVLLHVSQASQLRFRRCRPPDTR